ncbi:MAG: serine/threonine protein kinase [Bryobacterales bacterium]|nr:serine/threonine protein kinase [Bryobacterales bacterium]
MPFEAGQVIADYEILDTLGTGGMGQVYRVRNIISNRIEAMKVLLPNMTADPDFAARFSAEIRTLAAFDHPNIAQLRTAFQIGTQQLMVMEFVEGSTLDRLTQKGPLPQGEVIKIAKQVLSALSYAHSRGVVHRDIKPANIMVTSSGVVKLMDFGIAKSASEHKLTQPGSTIGSLYYMSPEQVRGATVDARSDIYSTGVLLYELLSGLRPFRASTTYALLQQQLNDTPASLIEVNPQVSRDLNDIVFLAIAKDPAARFQTADAFANALNAAANPAAAKPAPANPPPPNSLPLLSSQKSHRGLWLAGGAVAALLTLAGAATVAPHFFRTAANSEVKPAPVASPEPSKPVENGPASVLVTQPPVEKTPDPEPSPAAPSAVHRARAAETRKVAIPVPITPSAPEQVEPSQPSPQQPAANEPSSEDFARIQDELIQLNSRAGVVSSSLERLQQGQAADGLGLRQDVAGSYSRMNSYLHATDADLANSNLPAARRHMDLAEKEISTLEKFFNK